MSYKKLYQELKKKIEKDYGKKCEDFAWGCCVCEAYICLDFLETAYKLGEAKEILKFDILKK